MESLVPVTVLEDLAEWASQLELEDIPDRVIGYAKSQIVSQLAAARAGMTHPLGQKVMSAFGSPRQQDPRQAACVMAGLTSWLHFDDTAYAGHLSHSTVAVPVAYARTLELDGPKLLTAVIAANECASRITAAATLGPFRGLSAVHTHLAGSVAGRLRAQDGPADLWVNAFGLAFASPPWTLTHAFLSSDAKVLCALTPVRMGLDACDAAAAGLVGAPDIFEHPDGFLARFATVPLATAIRGRLGTRWHTETMSFKVHPGGPGMDAAIDCAALLHHDLGDFEVYDVAEVRVETSMYTLLLDQGTAPYIDGPDSPASALALSTAYTVATTLLTGDFGPADLAAPLVDDKRRWALAALVRVEHDEAMTRDSMTCEVPFGEALRQAGPQASTWLEEVGGRWLVDLVGEIPPPSETFETARKVTPARVIVRCHDGRVFQRQLDIPVGAVGSPTRVHHQQLVCDKFMATGGSRPLAGRFAELETVSASELATMLDAALTLT
jgi:2-methylcitrate dehydratase PrpD